MTLRALLDATPEPPETSDPDVLLAAFEVMAAARQALVGQLVAPVVEDPDALAMLAERERAWFAAIRRAQQTVASQCGAARKLRSYAPGL